MTQYLLTEEDRKAVREALSSYGAYKIQDTNKALAILDKLQRVEVVGHISPHLGRFVQEGSWRRPMPVNKFFYAEVEE